MEFKRSDYKLFENAINKVSEGLEKVFNEVGRLEYDIHQPKENGTKGYRIYDNYCHWGSLVVEPNSIYMGYEIGYSQRFLAVYIEEKYLDSPVGKEKILELIKENFGEFTIRNTKEECEKTSYRVFNKNALDLVFTRETRENLFNETNNHIKDFCIIFGGDSKKDKKKFDAEIKKLKPQVIY